MIEITETDDSYHRFLLFEEEMYGGGRDRTGFDSFLKAIRAAHKTNYDFARVLDLQTGKWYNVASVEIYPPTNIYDKVLTSA